MRKMLSDMAQSPVWKLWWGVFFLSAILYAGTAQRDISWQDSGMFQWRVLTGNYQGPHGLALAHPLYVAAAQPLRLAKHDTFPWLLNLFSGIGMAVALANLACLLQGITRNMLAVVLACALLALAHAVWWFSSVAEVYTWVLAGFSLELLLLERLLRKPAASTVILLGLVNGLGFSLHNLALLPTPVYVASIAWLLWSRKLAWRVVPITVLAYCVGASFYSAMIVIRALSTNGLREAVRSALFGNYESAVLNMDLAAIGWKASGGLLALSFTNVLLPLAFVGWWMYRRVLGNARAFAFGVITVIHATFVIRYPVPDQFAFLLPTMVMVCVAAGIGLDATMRRGKAWCRTAMLISVFSIAFMPILYSVLPNILQDAGFVVQRARELPYRNEVRYWIVPWKHDEKSARLFAEAALREAAPDGIILADGTTVHPLLLSQAGTNTASGVLIHYGVHCLPAFDEDPVAFRQAVGNKKVFVVSPHPSYMPAGMAGLLGKAKFHRPDGHVLYRLIDF